MFSSVDDTPVSGGIQGSCLDNLIRKVGRMSVRPAWKNYPCDCCARSENGIDRMTREMKHVVRNVHHPVPLAYDDGRAQSSVVLVPIAWASAHSLSFMLTELLQTHI